MNRRSFLKAVGVAVMVPALPAAETAETIVPLPCWPIDADYTYHCAEILHRHFCAELWLPCSMRFSHLYTSRE